MIKLCRDCILEVYMTRCKKAWKSIFIYPDDEEEIHYRPDARECDSNLCDRNNSRPINKNCQCLENCCKYHNLD